MREVGEWNEVVEAKFVFRVALEEHVRRFMLKLVGEYLKEFEEALAAYPET